MQRHGLFETLERDHCSPSMEAALTAIAQERGQRSGEDPDEEAS